MAKIFFTCTYHRNAKRANAGKLLRYIATRESVEKVPKGIDHAPSTVRQQRVINEMLKELPQTVKYDEYKKYLSEPCKSNATDFITAVINRNDVSGIKNLVKYIAERPGVEKLGSHGLFSQSDDKIDLDKVAEDVNNNGGIIFTHIISLRREDAERLGYNNAKAWRDLIRRNVTELAEAHNISISNMEWYLELFILELCTGMRRGEIVALQWDDLNMQTGELHISRQATTVKGKIHISAPKTKSSIRTIILPPDIVKMLGEYKKTVDSKWMFPSPVKEDAPRHPSAVRKILDRTLERAECKHIRFHDLRHTFATTALANGMDIKTLSAMIGHISSETTLNIYTHTTESMKRSAADKIERGIGRNEGDIAEVMQTPDKTAKPPVKAKYEPKQPKIRRPGTGCISQINDHLFEGRYSPIDAYGNRTSRNVYAKTREECEIKLAEMIAKMKAEIKAEKEKLKAQHSA